MDIYAKQGEIQQALDSAAASGGGRVVLDGSFTSGTLHLRSNVELHFTPGSSLHGSLDIADYPDFSHALCESFDGYFPEKSRKALLVGTGVENIAITGLGIIDLHGPEFYARNHVARPEGVRHWPKPDFPRPRLLQLAGCRRVLIEHMAFRDSPGWSFWLAGCEDMVIHGISLSGDSRMMNNDGIHLDSCRKVRISDCDLSTGDDAIVIRAIRKDPVRAFVAEKITVSNCTLESSCQCIRIGCPLDGDIRDCVLGNLVMRGRNGISLECPAHYRDFRHELRDSGASQWIEGILFQNVSMQVENSPLLLRLAPDQTMRHYGGLSFSHVRMHGGAAVELKGAPLAPVQDVLFSEVDFNLVPQLEHVRHVVFRNCTAAGAPLEQNGTVARPEA